MHSLGLSRILIISLAVIILAAAAVLVLRRHYDKVAAPAITPSGFPANSASVSPSVSPASSPASPVASTTLKIPELGIQITVPSSIKDVEYITDPRVDNSSYFSTVSLAELGGSYCSPKSSPIGIISVSKTNMGDLNDSNKVKTLDGLNVYYLGPESTCEQGDSASPAYQQATALQGSQAAALKQASQSAQLIPK